MREPDYHGLRDVVGRSVQQRASRLRTGRRVRTSGVALALAVLLGLGGFTALTPTVRGPAPGESLPSGNPVETHWQYLLWAGAGDATHLYALVSDCGSCPTRLLASADSGRSWQQRSDFDGSRGPYRIHVVGPQALFVDLNSTGQSSPISFSEKFRRYQHVADWRVSLDGGTTWRKPLRTDVPVAAAAADDSVLRSAYDEKDGDAALYVLDRSTGSIAPLASQPPLVRFWLTDVPASIGVWVMGIDPVSRRPAVAVSRDRGATWTLSVFAGEAPVPSDDDPVAGQPSVASVDGRTAYAVFTEGDATARIYRSADAGRSWIRTNPDRPLSEGYRRSVCRIGPALLTWKPWILRRRGGTRTTGGGSRRTGHRTCGSPSMPRTD
ncbi:hypothetical protein ACWDV4_09620 [Micromonospora sp. NPDC003197]